MRASTAAVAVAAALLCAAVAVLAHRVPVARLAAAHASGAGVTKPVQPCKWTLYKQCDPHWGSALLGMSPNETVCTDGCAMSSTAMALASHGFKIEKAPIDPGSLNAWLTKNSGYVDYDLIVWTAVEKLGPVRFMVETTSMAIDDIKSNTTVCNAVIANVMDGHHWVLVIGWDDASNDTFMVNDPGFQRLTYQYSDMVKWVVFAF